MPAPFVISSDTDYVAMGHYADLLARTLTNMRDYYASSALAAPAVCDLQQIEIVTTRLAGQIRECTLSMRSAFTVAYTAQQPAASKGTV